MSSRQRGLVYPYGVPGCRGRIKQNEVDFQVTEQLGFTPYGAGEHLFLYLQKSGLTTQQLISRLSEQTGVAARHIGYSGLKDKQAVTRQWLSMQLPGCKQMPEISQDEQVQLLQSHWHERKLRVGTHRSNRFEVVIRQVKGECERLNSVIQQIEHYGFCNYFGEQRFGTQQDNVGQALRVLNNRHKLKRLSRHKKSLYLSALRSELFNQILSRRIEQGIWRQPEEGDIFMLAGSQSVFVESLSDEIRQRYQEFDIHSGISLFGTGDSRLNAQALAIENDVIDANPEMANTLLDNKLKRAFRSSRARARNLKVEFSPQRAELHLQVELDKGVYLTSLLAHFIDVLH